MLLSGIGANDSFVLLPMIGESLELSTADFLAIRIGQRCANRLRTAGPCVQRKAVLGTLLNSDAAKARVVEAVAWLINPHAKIVRIGGVQRILGEHVHLAF